MTWAGKRVVVRDSRSVKPVRQEKAQILSKMPQKRGPFKCSRCDSEFRSRRNRRRHGAREHRDSEQKFPLEHALVPASECRAVKARKVAISEGLGDAETQTQPQPEAQEKVKPVIQEKGKPEAQKKGKPETQKEGKPETSKKGKPVIQEKGETETQEKDKLKKAMKSSVSSRTERRIPREVKKGSIEVVGKHKKMYDDLKHDQEKHDLKAEAECAVSVTKPVRNENNPKRNADRDSNRKVRQNNKLQDEDWLRTMAGPSANAMASLDYE